MLPSGSNYSFQSHDIWTQVISSNAVEIIGENKAMKNILQTPGPRWQWCDYVRLVRLKALLLYLEHISDYWLVPGWDSALQVHPQQIQSQPNIPRNYVHIAWLCTSAGISVPKSERERVWRLGVLNAAIIRNKHVCSPSFIQNSQADQLQLYSQPVAVYSPSAAFSKEEWAINESCEVTLLFSVVSQCLHEVAGCYNWTESRQ